MLAKIQSNLGMIMGKKWPWALCAEGYFVVHESVLGSTTALKSKPVWKTCMCSNYKVGWFSGGFKVMSAELVLGRYICSLLVGLTCYHVLFECCLYIAVKRH